MSLIILGKLFKFKWNLYRRKYTSVIWNFNYIELLKTSADYDFYVLTNCYCLIQFLCFLFCVDFWQYSKYILIIFNSCTCILSTIFIVIQSVFFKIYGSYENFTFKSVYQFKKNRLCIKLICSKMPMWFRWRRKNA